MALNGLSNNFFSFSICRTKTAVSLPVVVGSSLALAERNTLQPAEMEAGQPMERIRSSVSRAFPM